MARFDTDTVYLQTGVETNVQGAISTVWTNGAAVLCNVQDISSEAAMRAYGVTEAGDKKKVFDNNLTSGWVVANEVSYLSEQWRIVYVKPNMTKIGLSNHIMIILLKVIE